MDTIIGTVGLLSLLVAFVANQFKKLDPETALYNLLNVLGGTLLAYYAIQLESIPFLVLEIVWTAFALYKLIQIRAKKIDPESRN